ncbi:MAG: Rho termination factor N-terminal domain-containing protein, partial [Lachnospiraceae bacterium]|nr:Rho termination factor N-terminal domain-containing protein [Lachnospiraceae bacterium]
MTESELRSIAESMGIKKVESLQQEDLVYKILDQQATDFAATSSFEKKRKEPKTPRGPKAKNANKADKVKEKKSSDSKDQDTNSAEASEPVAEQDNASSPQMPLTPGAFPEPPRRRRGRPSKEQLAAEARARELQNQLKAELTVTEPVTELPAQTLESEPDHRDMLTMTSPLPTDSLVESDSLPILPPADNTSEASIDTLPTENDSAEVNQNPQDADMAQAPKRDFRPSKDSSFGAFFRTERKFVPRSKREK